MARPTTGEDRLARTTEAAGGLASPGDFTAFEDAFMRLLERRIAAYTQGDSSSVPAHVAVDLLRSISFVLGIDLEERLVPEHLLGVDLEREFKRRLADVDRQVEDAERLWREVCIAMPLVPNIALRDTLAAIHDFFEHYDTRSMAHDIPCSIDYPLCHPVDGSIMGVDYIAEYLRRLMIEARFLQLFEVAACERVLSHASPDHVELLVNLYEPVAVNAIGLALVGQDPAHLVISDSERDAIQARLRPLGAAGRELALREAATSLCDDLGVSDAEAREYLSDIVPELLPRIEVAMSRGSLRGVFVG